MNFDERMAYWARKEAARQERRRLHARRGARTPLEESGKLRDLLQTTARRSVALRRLYPGAVIRWRRSKTAKVKTLSLVVFRPGQPPELATLPAAHLAELAAQVSDEDAAAEVFRHGRVDP